VRVARCDVDLDGGVATINQQLQQYDGHMVVGPPKTARSVRTIALDRTTIATLRRHRQRQERERVEMGESYQDSVYMFTGLHGDPLAPDRLTRTFRQLTVETGMPPIWLHDLRHGHCCTGRCPAILTARSPVSRRAGSSEGPAGAPNPLSREPRREPDGPPAPEDLSSRSTAAAHATVPVRAV
jgi:integrase